MTRRRHDEAYRASGHAPGYGAVRSGGWSVTLWASIFYLALCLGGVLERLGVQLVGGLDWLWPRPLELALQRLVPLGLASWLVAAALGYGAVAGLAVLLELVAPTFRSTWARALAALLVCGVALFLLAFGARELARSLGWPTGE